MSLVCVRSPYLLHDLVAVLQVFVAQVSVLLLLLLGQQLLLFHLLQSPVELEFLHPLHLFRLVLQLVLLFQALRNHVVVSGFEVRLVFSLEVVEQFALFLSFFEFFDFLVFQVLLSLVSELDHAVEFFLVFPVSLDDVFPLQIIVHVLKLALVVEHLAPLIEHWVSSGDTLLGHVACVVSCVLWRIWETHFGANCYLFVISSYPT